MIYDIFIYGWPRTADPLIDDFTDIVILSIWISLEFQAQFPPRASRSDILADGYFYASHFVCKLPRTTDIFSAFIYRRICLFIWRRSVYIDDISQWKEAWKSQYFTT